MPWKLIIKLWIKDSNSYKTVVSKSICDANLNPCNKTKILLVSLSRWVFLIGVSPQLCGIPLQSLSLECFTWLMTSIKLGISTERIKIFHRNLIKMIHEFNMNSQITSLMCKILLPIRLLLWVGRFEHHVTKICITVKTFSLFIKSQCLSQIWRSTRKGYF